MNTLFTIKSIASCAVLAGATASFAQNSGHSGHAGHGAQSLAEPIVSQTAASPYAGEQTRTTKALSAADVDALQSGAGTGYAKAAELNGYPGPMHVLELASPLQLDAQQRQASEQLLSDHKARARALGGQVLAAERHLDQAFAAKQMNAEQLQMMTARIGELQSALRAEHLRTHLQQTALLSPQQIASYQVLRGYGNTDAGKPLPKTQ